MMTGDIGFLMAFLGGVLSFVSPCVLPLVPAYFCFLTGASLDELTESGKTRVNTLPRALAFVLGFSTVFVALGAGASLLSQLLRSHLDLFSLLAGAEIGSANV